jgi:predicted DNA binding CopG/RHH family protein
LSPAEEARWWDEHPDYWESAEGRDERVEPARVRRTKPVNLRLPIEMIDELKREAERRAIPYQTLMRMWLKERLESRATDRGH